MKHAHEVQQGNWFVTRYRNNVRPALPVWLGLVVILGALASLSPPIAIAGILILLLGVVVLPRPILIVYGLIVALPLTNGLDRGALIPFLRLGQALLVGGGLLFALSRPAPQGKNRLTAVDLAFVFYMLAGAVFPMLSLYYRGEHVDLTTPDPVTGQSAFQYLLGPLQYYVLYRIVVATVSTERQIKVILNLIFVTSSIVSAIGILQKLGIGPLARFLETYYPPVSQGFTISAVDQRITSTIGFFSALGQYLCFIMIIAIACYAARERLRISTLLLAITVLLDGIALILTGTIASWIGLAIGGMFVFILIGRIPKVFLFLPLSIFLAAFIFQPFISSRLEQQFGLGAAQGLIPQSLALRIKLWNDLFFPAIGQHIFLGSGPSPRALISWDAEDSGYLMLLLRGGLLDLLSYIVLMGVAIRVCWRRIQDKSEDVSRTLAIALLAILVALNVMNITAEYFTYAAGTQILWLLLAIIVASEQLKVLEIPTVARRNGDSQALLSAGSEASSLEQPHPWFVWMKRLLDWHLIKDSVVVGIGSTLARGLGLLFLILLARYLTPDDFGFFRYATTLMTVVCIASANSPVSISRFIAANRDDHLVRDCYFSNGVTGSAMLLAVTLLLSIPILGWLHALNIGTLICIIGYTGFYIYFAIARGLGSAWKMGLSYFLSNVVQLVVVFAVLGYFGLHTVTVALAIYGLTYLSPLAMMLFTPMKLKFRLSFISKTVLLELGRFALPVVIASGAYALWFGMDILLIENFSPHVAGIYAAAKTLSGAFLFMPSAITLVLMPRVAAQGAEKSKRYALGAVLISLLICLIGLVIVYFWGHKLIALTFGERYRNAYLPLLILSAGMSILSVYTVLEGLVIGGGRPKLLAQALIVALVSTTVTGFWLTPRLGASGASLAFSIGAAFASIMILVRIRPFSHMREQEARRELSGSAETWNTEVQ